MNKAIFARISALALVGVAAVTLASPASAARCRDGQNRNVRIINETGAPILRFFSTNVSANAWGGDLLGRGVIPTGQSLVVNIDDGSCFCQMDFKAVFNDDRPDAIRRRINVCQVSTYRYYEN